jgi:UDP-glucose 4-epimerase
MGSMLDPIADLEINVTALVSMLEVCKTFNPDVKIVHASTRQIYGSPDYLPVKESHPIRPVDVNGINKSAAEQYLMLYNKV